MTALMFACGWPLILPVLLAFGLYSFKWGLYALREARQATGTTALTLRFLALHLCEPLLNGIVIGCLFVTLFPYSTGPAPLLLTFAFTTPMAILAVPLYGMTFDNPDDQAVCRSLFRRGMVRWGLTYGIFVTTLTGIYGVDIIFFLGGCYALEDCVSFGKDCLHVSWES